MSRDLKTLYKSLTPPQRQFLSSKRLNGNYHPGKLTKFLAKVSQFDRLGDEKRVRVKTFGGWFLATGIILTIASLIIRANTLNSVFYAGTALGGLLILAAIILFLVAKSLRKNDLNDNIRKFALPIVAILREEMLPTARFKLKLLGDSATHKQYLKKKIPRKERYGRAYEIYQHPWFSCSAKLCDGSQLSFSLVRQVRVIHIKKRTPRGKIKHKTKHKYTDLTLLKLSAPSSRYAAAGGKPGNARVEQQANKVVVKAKAKQKSSVEKEPDYRQFLQQVQGLYANLKAVKS